MPVEPAKLVVGIASSALFDLREGDQIFATRGVRAYRSYQAEHKDDPLAPGIAFPFVRRLLELNEIQTNLVDVIVMSHNSPQTGLRVTRSIEHHKLPIARAVFREGCSAYSFIPAFGMSLFLSANAEDVKKAVDAGHPAGQVLHGRAFDTDHHELRVAFDFDGVLGDDSSERVFKEEGIDGFIENERTKADTPLPKGPLVGFLRGLNHIQTIEDERAENDSSYLPRLRISLVTARSTPAYERAINSLQAWGLRVDDAFFLAGLPKTPVINELKPHLFFDDQYIHLGEDLASPAVHIPFGVRNKPGDFPSAETSAGHQLS